MSLTYDLAGSTVGLLTVLRRLTTDERRMLRLRYGSQVLWHCRCACGTELVLPQQHLTQRRGRGGCRMCLRTPEAQRYCRWCGPGKRTTRPPWTECSTCNRRAYRNGRDESGRPLRRFLDPQRPCPCGRPRARQRSHCNRCRNASRRAADRARST